MNNPYDVLGVSPSASEDEIKKAYKTLSRKYHPDANINNPNKEQAEEKFKEIQAAYQQIMNSKKNGESGYGYGGSYGSGYGGYGSGGSYGSGYGGYGSGGSHNYGPFGGFGGFGDFGGFDDRSYGGGFRGNTSNDSGPDAMRLNAAANYINSGHYKEALNTLASINERTARWYYYSAIANHGVGNNVLALQHAKTAASMEPNNYQYAQLVQTLESGGSWYSGRQQSYGNVYSMNTGSCCNSCMTFMCLNALCGCC